MLDAFEFIYTINGMIGFLAGYLFANMFPFPDGIWKKIQVPVGVGLTVLVIGSGAYYHLV